jgi:hypothetical protein
MLNTSASTWTAGSRDIKIANRSFENVAKFRYLGTTITNQNLIQEEIKRRLNLGNACYPSPGLQTSQNRQSVLSNPGNAELL